MSTEMSDLAAVRIHSKTISIFSSRPIISRKRCTDCDWSSVETAARRSRKWSRRSDSAGAGRSAMYLRRRAGGLARDAEVGQLADAVFDVQPEPPERLHQGLDVECLVRP